MLVSTDHLLTTIEVAERFQVAPATVNRWARKGYLIAAKRFPGPRGQRWFHADDVEALLAPKPVEAQAS